MLRTFAPTRSACAVSCVTHMTAIWCCGDVNPEARVRVVVSYPLLSKLLLLQEVSVELPALSVHLFAKASRGSPPQCRATHASSNCVVSLSRAADGSSRSITAGGCGVRWASAIAMALRCFSPPDKSDQGRPRSPCSRPNSPPICRKSSNFPSLQSLPSLRVQLNSGAVESLVSGDVDSTGEETLPSSIRCDDVGGEVVFRSKCCCRCRRAEYVLVSMKKSSGDPWSGGISCGT